MARDYKCKFNDCTTIHRILSFSVISALMLVHMISIYGTNFAQIGNKVQEYRRFQQCLEDREGIDNMSTPNQQSREHSECHRNEMGAPPSGGHSPLDWRKG